MKLKTKIVFSIFAALSAAFLWQAFAQTGTPCETACKATWDACIKEKTKPGADPRIATALCMTHYVDCLDKCRFATLGTPTTPCQATCKTKFETCLKKESGTCGADYDICMLECK